MSSSSSSTEQPLPLPLPDCCLAAIHPAPREVPFITISTFTSSDGSKQQQQQQQQQLCRHFMWLQNSCTYPDCKYAHVEKADRPTCWLYERYGVCNREEGQCWYPHPLYPIAAEPHIALQCELQFGHRVVGRIRDLIGPSAVVGVGRSALMKRCTVCILVNCGSSSASDVAGTIRTLLKADPHMASVLGRVYVLSNCDDDKGKNIDDKENKDEGNDGNGEIKNENNITKTDIDSNNKLTSIEAAVQRIRELALESGSTSLPLRVRTRGFPKDVEHQATAALAVEAQSGLLEIATARDCDLCLDAVRVWGRTYIAVWKPEQIVEQEQDSEQEQEQGKGLKQEEDELQGEKEELQPQLRTLNDVVYHIETLKEGRITCAPICRAYWKLAEGILRASVPIAPDWNCADAGAAPGGWTQVKHKIFNSAEIIDSLLY
jgi:hypothetical protein